MKTRLTERVVKALEPPGHGTLVCWDSEIPGFGIKVYPSGTKSFFVDYRVSGRQRRPRIGSWPTWSVRGARDEAASYRRAVDRGEDPLGQREAERRAPTVAELAERYMREHAVKKRSGQNDAALLEKRILPHLARTKVAAVRFEDVEALHRRITDAGWPVRANHTVSLLSTMFGLAIRWGYRADNPCRGVTRNTEHKRERYLDRSELTRLAAALAEHDGEPGADVIWLLLLSGARKGEVLQAQWQDFNLEAAVWVKPAATTKANRAHRIPLSRAAVAVLRRRAARIEDSPMVFPRTSNSGLQRFWRGLCRAASIDGVRIHDLRHCAASILVNQGQSLPLIGSILGHTQAATTNRYIHLQDEAQRAAVEAIAKAVTDE